MLNFSQITKQYGSLTVLKDVSLQVARGECVCVAGANSQGKTTLLSIGAGLLTPEKGRVAKDGGVGFVPQENALLEELSVRDNLLLWYSACRKKTSLCFREDSPEARLGLSSFAKQKISRLSGGMKKRASIAAALAGDPDYLLMDEPFAALDLESKEEISLLLRQLASQGKGILFSSHDPAQIAAAAQRLYVLRDAHIRQEACPDPALSLEERTRRIIELIGR